MSLDIAYDSSVFIDRSIDGVFQTLGEAVVLVVLVIFIFLRPLRATVVPLGTIPLQLISSYAIMYELGFSINTLTLLSMVLACGHVVAVATAGLAQPHRHIKNEQLP